MATPRSEIEELHRLVDSLPAEDVPRARRLLAQLRLERTLAEAPEGPPLSPEEREALEESEADRVRGDVLSDAALDLARD